MNLRDLKYLVSLTEHGHFGKAAEACFVSQPALSMQIKKLEETLGVKLLERTNKSVLLTDTGATIAAQARQILQQVQEVHEIAQSSQDPYSGKLKLGVFPTLAPYLLPLIIPHLSKNYPKVSFYLVEEPTASLLEKLRDGKLHAALLASPLIETGLKHAPLFEEEFLLALPNTHPLTQRKQVTSQDLDNKNLLLLEEGHCMREQALTVCQKMKAVEAQDFRATSLETLRHMITAGVGITLMPKLACHVSPNICYVPFAEPKPMRSIGLFWRNCSAKQILLEDMAVKIKNILSQQKVVSVL